MCNCSIFCPNRSVSAPLNMFYVCFSCMDEKCYYGKVKVDIVSTPSVTGLYGDTDNIVTHVLSTVAIQSVSLYSPCNGPYSDTFFSDFLCKK